MAQRFSNGSVQLAPLAFDYQSTTPCDPEVFDAMTPYFNEIWGNPSSRQNHFAVKAAAAVSLARDQLSYYLGVHPDKLIFTSGATEANNLALLGFARAKALENKQTGHLITLSTEHLSVLDPLRQLRKEGFVLTELLPNSEGFLSVEALKDSFSQDTLLVSVMIANNEIGVLQPIKALSSLCAERGIMFHADAAQSFGKIPIDNNLENVDILTISGHKIYGPKGIGALALRSNLPIIPLQWGGGQEYGLRPGTLPVALIVGLAKAAELSIKNISSQQKKIAILRNQLWYGLKNHLPDLILNGSLINRLPNNLNFTVPNVIGSRLQQELRKSVACTSGSACSAGMPSYVLTSIGRTVKEANSSLRLSLGKDTTDNDIQKAIIEIVRVVEKLRSN